MTIEAILAQINNNPKSIIDMDEAELLKILDEVIKLEPKAIPRPLVESLIKQAEKAIDAETDEVNCPIKKGKKGKTKIEKAKNLLANIEQQLKALEE